MKLNEQIQRIKQMMGLLNEQQVSNDSLYDLKDEVYNGKVVHKIGVLEFKLFMSKSNLSFETELSEGSLEEIIISFVRSNSYMKYDPQVSPYLIYYKRVSILPKYTKMLDFIKPIEEELKGDNLYCKFEEFGTGYVRVNIGVIGEEPSTVTNQAEIDYNNKQKNTTNNNQTQTNVTNTQNQNQGTSTNQPASTTNQNQGTSSNQPASTTNQNTTTNTPTTNQPAPTTNQNNTSAQTIGQEKIVTNFDRAYDYKMDTQGNFFFKGKPNTAASKTYPDWTSPKNQNALNAIKTKVFKQK